MVQHQIPGLPKPIDLPDGIRVIVNILPASQRNQRPGHKLWGGSASFYTQHETGNPRNGMGALAHRNYLFNGAPDGAGNPQILSYHATGDDREIYVLLPFDEVGWHAGDGGGTGNFDSIAYELCVNADMDHAKARRNAAAFAAGVMNVLGIPVENYKPHQWWSGKWCPAELLNENAFDEQRALVGKLMTPATPQVPVYPKGGLIPDVDGEDVRINGVTFWWIAREWKVLAPSCPRHVYADPATPHTGPDLPRGATFRGKWIAQGATFDGSNEWVVTEWGSRLPMSRLTPRVDITL